MKGLLAFGVSVITLTAVGAVAGASLPYFPCLMIGAVSIITANILQFNHKEK